MGLGSWASNAWDNTKPQILPIAGGAAGFFLSGGNPAGAAAGYIATDQLLNDGQGMDALTSGEASVDQASTLTAEQLALLGMSANASQANLATLYGEYGKLATSPIKSTYEDVADWENKFQNGVVNPAMNQLNSLIDNTKHSSNLHSSANRYAQDQLRQGTMDSLSGMRYQNTMAQQQMKQAGLDDAYTRQLAALGGLSNLNANALGVQGVENIVTPKRDWMDLAGLGVNAYAASKK